MATIRIPEAEAAKKFASLMTSVRADAEVVIENGTIPVAVLSSPTCPHRTIEECIALLPESSDAVMDDDFARDVQAAIDAHREPLNPPDWD